MNDLQRGEFLKYGCLSKAIIKACDSNISVDDFCAKYDSLFFPEFYGIPRAEERATIIADLGYSIVSDEWGFDSVRDLFNLGHPVITIFHVMLVDNDTSELNHATVLHSISDKEFQVWSYIQDGDEGLLPVYPKEWWTEKKFHGLILTTKDGPAETSPE